MRKFIDPFFKSPLIRSIIMINIGVFLAWQFAIYTQDIKFMGMNFLVSFSSLYYGRWWTLLTSVFSHNAFFHILINMFVLKSFGPIVLQVTGKRFFLFFYLIAGIGGSLSHALTSAFLIGEPNMPALGASGAIAGVILLFSLLFPDKKILLLGFVPVRAIWGALLFIGIDLWGLIAQTKGGGLPIGHGAHLGGALIGLIAYFIMRQRLRSHHDTLVL